MLAQRGIVIARNATMCACSLGIALGLERLERAGTPDSARMRIPPVAVETTALVPPTATDTRPSGARGETAPSNPQTVAAGDDPAAGAALDRRIGNLNERQLKTLLNEIDHMEATPIIDPEPVVLRVGGRATSPTGL